MGRRKPSTPRLEQRRGVWTADLRPWGGSRYTQIRDPRGSGRLARGASEAARWSLHYVDQPKRITEDDAPMARAVAAYLADRSHLAATTRRNLRTVLRHHLLKATSPRSTLRTFDWVAYFGELEAAGLQLSTRHHHYRVIRAFLRASGAPEALRSVRLPKLRQTPPRTLTAAQVAAIDGDFGAIARVAFATGARISELLELRWEDFEEDVVRIERQRLPDGEVTLPKGGNVRQTFVLPQAGLERGLRGYVCRRPDGRRHNHSSLIAAAKAATGSYGMHIYRHSYARTFLAQPGTSLHMLQAMLGHLSPESTEIYKHFSETDALRLARGAFRHQ